MGARQPSVNNRVLAVPRNLLERHSPRAEIVNPGVRRLLAALLAALLLTGTGANDLDATLRAVAKRYYAQAGLVAAVAGPDTTMDYYDRLIDDLGLLSDAPPTRYPPALWRQTTQTAAALDASLATQLLARSYVPMASIRGLGVTLIRSSRDGTMQPVAVYVPTAYAPTKAAPLAVFLHGNQQPETHLLAPAYLQAMAERSGTIVVAPYGRGAYDFTGAEGDVDDAVAAAKAAFSLDDGKRYLVGYSMGGFSIFRIAPLHPNDWTAVLSIAGSLLGSRSQRVASTLARTRFYVVTGALDDNVPTAYPTATAIFLRDAGLAVTFYSQADGTHSLYSLRAAVSQAWEDMERGIVRLPEGLTGPANLPEAVH
jgi:dienelactone hydrolase